MQEEFKITNDILASHGQRLANLFIDRILFTALFLGIVVLLVFVDEFLGTIIFSNFFDRLEEINWFLDMIITGLLFSIFYVILEYFLQKTIGKYISKTKVVLENGEKPTFKAIVVRSLCRVIPFEQFSFFGKNAYGWHDSISKTYVVDEKKFNAQKEIHNGFKELGKNVGEVVT